MTHPRHPHHCTHTAAHAHFRDDLFIFSNFSLFQSPSLLLFSLFLGCRRKFFAFAVSAFSEVLSATTNDIFFALPLEFGIATATWLCVIVRSEEPSLRVHSAPGNSQCTQHLRLSISAFSGHPASARPCRRRAGGISTVTGAKTLFLEEKRNPCVGIPQVIRYSATFDYSGRNVRAT